MQNLKGGANEGHAPDYLEPHPKNGLVAAITIRDHEHCLSHYHMQHIVCGLRMVVHASASPLPILRSARTEGNFSVRHSEQERLNLTNRLLSPLIPA